MSIDLTRRIDSFQKTFWSKGFDSVALHGDKQQLLAGSFFLGGELLLLFTHIYIYIYRIYHLSTNTSLFQGIFLQQKQHIVQVRKTATWIYTFWYFNWFAAPSAFRKHQLLFFVPKCVVVWWSGIFCSIFFFGWWRCDPKTKSSMWRRVDPRIHHTKKGKMKWWTLIQVQ